MLINLIITLYFIYICYNELVLNYIFIIDSYCLLIKIYNVKSIKLFSLILLWFLRRFAFFNGHCVDIAMDGVVPCYVMKTKIITTFLFIFSCHPAYGTAIKVTVNIWWTAVGQKKHFQFSKRYNTFSCHFISCIVNN